MLQARTLCSPDFQDALDHVRSRSADYRWLWEECRRAPNPDQAFGALRARVDPAKPYFFGELSNGIRFAGDARDFPAALHALNPDCNSTLIRALISALPEGPGNVVDVGTNIGVVAASLARHLGSRGRVLAFEPSPTTTLIAAATLALNGLENVSLIQAAAGDLDGEITFHATPGNSAIASTRNHGFTHLNSWQEITVPSRRLDSMDLGSVLLIKIDVEGHELNVLRGAIETLHRARPITVYEYTPIAAPTHGWTAEDSVALFSGLGPYRFTALTEPPVHQQAEGGRWLPFPLPDGIRDQVNVFAQPQD
ncbi:FkbM family methyltransferase [Phenylobacterium sp. LjRoot219]|uniref:FkbM family methyltransferase n=1 Tax=Phenylobacterium sp. LjRoot219 TaxID=3342283 RepID=UPI003ED074A5